MNQVFARNVGGGSGASSDQLLTDHEAAAILRCGRSTVWRWAAQGTIPRPLKIGGTARWRRSWIDQVIERAAQDQAA